MDAGAEQKTLPYRPEIDGLRAVAIVPVMMMHAGWAMFSGGFVGVDVFFVISGYLITWNILLDMRAGTFSLLKFYERRARRILPALFLVAFVSIVFAYEWMLPDELENYGQSLVATVLFANNILLTLTSNYWSLASEFKPLLHTWSLAVEEQYYLLFPFFMMIFWRAGERWMMGVLCLMILSGLALAEWGSYHQPTANFYLLPTRGWAILVGALAAIWACRKDADTECTVFKQTLSLIGFGLIVGSICLLRQEIPYPGFYALFPVCGAAFVVLYATNGTIVRWFLARRALVVLGQISYSAYLFHVPIFAFARIYAVDPPDKPLMMGLCAAALGLSFLSWKYFESPFRDFKMVSSRYFVRFSVTAGFILLCAGYAFHATHGVPNHDLGNSNEFTAGHTIAYNARVFELKRNSFNTDRPVKVLIIGQSFARDFVNMINENFAMKSIEIVYRDDVGDCISQEVNNNFDGLYEMANVVIFADGNNTFECVNNNIDLAKSAGKEIFYVGTKHFGYNLNWIKRLDPQARIDLCNKLPSNTIALDAEMRRYVPERNFISFVSAGSDGVTIPVTDEFGRLLSPDRRHLTKSGAMYFGKKMLVPERIGRVLRGEDS